MVNEIVSKEFKRNFEDSIEYSGRDCDYTYARNMDTCRVKVTVIDRQSGLAVWFDIDDATVMGSHEVIPMSNDLAERTVREFADQVKRERDAEVEAQRATINAIRAEMKAEEKRLKLIPY